MQYKRQMYWYAGFFGNPGYYEQLLKKNTIFKSQIVFKIKTNTNSSLSKGMEMGALVLDIEFCLMEQFMLVQQTTECHMTTPHPL